MALHASTGIAAGHFGCTGSRTAPPRLPARVVTPSSPSGRCLKRCSARTGAARCTGSTWDPRRAARVARRSRRSWRCSWGATGSACAATAERGLFLADLVKIALQRANLLPLPRHQLSHESEAEENQPGDDEQQHEVEECPVALLEDVTLDHLVHAHYEAEEHEQGPGDAEEQHRLAAEAHLEPHREEIERADRNPTDPELRLARLARMQRHRS